MSDARREGEAMKALVIEDSAAMRAIICQFLHELGFESVEAGTGREGLERIAAMDRVDVVLVDLHMPEMDGQEFLRAARAIPRFRDTPMMVVTTQSELSSITASLEAGTNEYLMKPFDRKGLLEKLLILGLDPNRMSA
jgi:two-component system, chemotaxis family, chemotaxis protein CheY